MPANLNPALDQEADEVRSDQVILPQPTWRRRLSAAIRILLGVGLVYFVVQRNGSLQNLGQLLRNPWLLALLGSFPLAGAAIEAHRLSLLFRAAGFQLSPRVAIKIVAVATLFNFVIPGGTGGDVMKFYYLGTGQPGKGVEAATVILLDRAVALFAWLMVILSLGIFNGAMITRQPAIQWLTSAVVIGAGGLLALAMLIWSQKTRQSRIYEYLTSRAPLHRYLDRIAEALYLFRERKTTILAAIGLSAIGHVMLAVVFMVVGRQLIPAAPPLQVGFLAFMGMLANVLPVTPGGLGVGEAAFASLFAYAGYAGGAQLVLAWRAGLIPLGILGAIFFLSGSNSIASPTDVSPSDGS